MSPARPSHRSTAARPRAPGTSMRRTSDPQPASTVPAQSHVRTTARVGSATSTTCAQSCYEPGGSAPAAELLEAVRVRGQREVGEAEDDRAGAEERRGPEHPHLAARDADREQRAADDERHPEE